MSHKIRRRVQRAWRRRNSQKVKSPGLRLESLEQRVLLDVAGLWDELGWRSATGGGISWDTNDIPGEAQLVTTSDGDPAVLWIEGTFNEYIDSPIPYDWRVEGNIYARQYGEDTGWWDLGTGGGDTVVIGTGSELAVAAGSTGGIVAVWTSANEIYARGWTGFDWVDIGNPGGPGMGGWVSEDDIANESPSVAVNELGEIFVSYTTWRRPSGQKEIVVKKWGYAYDEKVEGPPQQDDLQWVELTSEEIDPFEGLIGSSTGGVSNDVYNSFDSSITVDLEGRPVVAWASENFEGNIDIYVKRWDGDNWVELGTNSASDPDDDGQGGVSNDETISIQPDIAIAENGDVIVTWVNWNNWEGYDTNGQAGVYVKLLAAGTTDWVEYEAGISTTTTADVNAGIAPSAGWYYNPKVETTSENYPFIVWQGFGEGERVEADRNSDQTPESPIMAVYGSYFGFNVEEGDYTFTLMPDSDDTDNERASAYTTIDGEEMEYMCWMPTGWVGANDELIMAYTWRDSLADGPNHDYEIFVQEWDTMESDWVAYGRGGNFNGNDVFGSPENSAGYYKDIYLPNLERISDSVELGLLDRDNDPATEMDVMLANGKHVYLYSRETGAWSLIDPTSYEYASNFNDITPPGWNFTEVNPPSPDAGNKVDWEWEADGGASGAGDDVLTMTLGDGATVTADLEGQYRYNFTTTSEGFLNVDLNYYLELGANIPDQGALTLTFTVEDQADPGTAILELGTYVLAGQTGEATSSGWRTLSYDDVNVYNNTLAPDNYVLVADAVLNSSENGLGVPEDGQGVIKLDNPDIKILHGYGELFDLRGEPEVEYNVAGPPLLSYINTNPYSDDFGRPFVYQWTEEAWNLVGDGAAGPVGHEGNTQEDEFNRGISVQAGPNGTMLLAYLGNDGISELVYTRLWDGSGWTDAERGILPEGSLLEPVYYTNCDGYDWDYIGELQDGDYNALGGRIYNTWEWNFWDATEYGAFWADALAVDPDFEELLIEGAEEGGVNELDNYSGVPWMDIDGRFSEVGDVQTTGLEITVIVPSIDPVFNDDGTPEYLPPDYLGNNLLGEIDQQILMMDEGHIIVEAMYELDARGVPNADLNLYLYVHYINEDGDIVSDRVLIDSVEGGNIKEYSDLTTVSLDSKLLGLMPLVKGENVVRFQAEVDMSNDDLIFGYDNDIEGWEFNVVDSTIGATGVWEDGADLEDEYYDTGTGLVADLDLIAESGGLKIDLDGTGADPQIGVFEYDFRLGGDATVTFQYQLAANAAVDADATVVLMVYVDGEALTSLVDGGDLDYIGLTADGTDQAEGWEEFTIDLDDVVNANFPGLETLEAGEHTIRIEARLVGATAGVGTVLIDDVSIVGSGEVNARFDNIAIYQRIISEGEGVKEIDSFDFNFDDPIIGGDWDFVEINPSPDTGDEVEWEWDEFGGAGFFGGALSMTLGDGITVTSDLEGEFRYDFTTAEEGLVDVGLEFFLATGDNIGEDETLTATFTIEDTDTGVTVLELGTFVIPSEDGDFNGAWQTLEYDGLNGANSLPADDYTLVADAVLSSSAEGMAEPAGGQGVFKVDNVFLNFLEGFGTNFNDEDPMPDPGDELGWDYADVNDPGVEVDGDWDADAGSEGAGDGALEMILGDGTNESANLEGQFQYYFTTVNDGFVDIGLDYYLQTGVQIDSDETITVEFWIEEQAPGTDILYLSPTNPNPADPETSQYLLIGQGGKANNSGWQTLVQNDPEASNDFNFLSAGAYTLVVNAELTNSADGQGVPEDGQAALRLDNVVIGVRPLYASNFNDVTPVAPAGGWDFSEVNPDPDLLDEVEWEWKEVDGKLDDQGLPTRTDALEMILGDDTTVTEDLEGQFRYYFTTDDDGYLNVDLDYYLELGNNILRHETLNVTFTVADPLDLTTALVELGTFQIMGQAYTEWDPTANGGLGDRVLVPADDVVSSGWQTLSNYGIVDIIGADPFTRGDDFQFLTAGSYVLVADAVLSSSADSAEGDGTPETGLGIFRMDNVLIEVTPGYSDWEWFFRWDEADSGVNYAVGPDPNPYNGISPEGIYNFEADLHSSLDGPGVQTYRIEDVTQDERGMMAIGFRYRLNNNPNGMTVLIDGVPYDADGEPNPVTVEIPNRWWRYNPYPSVDYTTVWVVAPDIMPGEHTVEIQLETDNPLNATDLWIDNLTILATQTTRIEKPIVTLLPSGTGGARNFAVGMTSIGEEMLVYENADDVYPDGAIVSFILEFSNNGYHAGNIFELDSAEDEWNLYGNQIEATTSIDYTGVGVGFAMPVAVNYRIEDIAAGPNSVLWVALQHSTSEWVDTNDDGINNQADIHSWVDTSPPPYGWGPPTTLDVNVWRWSPHNDPLAVPGGPVLRWVDTGFAPVTGEYANTYPQLISSGGQIPTVIWNERLDYGGTGGGHALRYESNGVWGVLGTQDIQNDEYWSTIHIRDAIVRPDGYPIVSYSMNHLDSDGLREFLTADLLPSMTISEASEIPNDNVLYFGTTFTGTLTSSFTISNDGPGDLLIYDIEIGGKGTSATSPYSVASEFDYPLTIPEGESQAVTVLFDPIGISDGFHPAVLVVHSNNPDHATHPFGHFYELELRAEIINTADVLLDPDWLDFEDTLKGGTSNIEEVKLTNEGSEPLTISEWLFDGTNFAITRAFVSQAVPGGAPIVTDRATTNGKGADDDVVLAPDDFLTLQIEFGPDEVEIYNDTLYIRTDDAYDPLLVVAMTGNGISGGVIEITENSGDEPNDDILDFGSVVKGTLSDPITFTIENIGSTDFIIDKVFVTPSNTEIFISSNQSLQDPISLVPGETLVVEVVFSPSSPVPGDPLMVEELENTFVVIASQELSLSYELELLGLAVPEVPQIQILEDSGTANDSTLEFGPINAGDTEYQTFTIKNIGGLDLTLTSFLMEGINTPFIVIPSNNASSGDDVVLQTGEELPVQVSFSPTSSGPFDDNVLIIRSDSGKEPGYSDTYTDMTNVFLKGEVNESLLEVTDSQAPVDDGEIDFGVVGEDMTSGTETITLTNTGTGNLVITGWDVDDATNFTLEPAFAGNITLVPGETRDLTVRFNPGDIGLFSGTVTVSSDNNPDAQIVLTGMGAVPGEVTITDSDDDPQQGGDPLDREINFTNVFGNPLAVGLDTAPAVFTITNTGDADLLVKGIQFVSTVTVFSLDIDGAENLDQAVSSDDVLLEPGESQTVIVTFAPNSLYDDTVQVEVTTNNTASSGPDLVSYVTLTGQSVYAMTVGVKDSVKQTKQAFFDSDGDLVQVKVTGGGYAVVILENGLFTGEDIERIELVNTTAKTVLTVSASDDTTIGRITGGTVKNIILKNVVVDGQGVDDDVIDIDIETLTGQITMDGLSNGADIQIDNVLGRGAKLKLGDVGDGSDVEVNGAVALLQANGFGDGMVHVQSLNKLNIGKDSFSAWVQVDGDMKNATLKSPQVDGSFIVGGSLNQLTANKAIFTGTVNAESINKISFRGLDGADISVEKLLKTLTVRSNMTNSRVSAGYDLGSDGRLGGVGTAADNLFSGGSIGRINIREQVANSYVSAGVAPDGLGNFLDPTNETKTGSIGMVKFGSVNFDNGGSIFGVAAHSGIDKVQVGSTVFDPNKETGNDFKVRIF